MTLLNTYSPYCYIWKVVKVLSVCGDLYVSVSMSRCPSYLPAICLEECNLDLIVSAVSLFAQRLLCIWRWHFFRLQQKQEVMSNIRGMFVMLLEQKANLHGFVLHSNRLVQLLTHSYLL